MAAKPVIAITMGDAAGIGPEVVIKAVADRDVLHECRCVIIGDLQTLQKAAIFTQTEVQLCNFSQSETVGMVEVVDLDNLPDRLSIGVETPKTGQAAMEYIDAAVRLCQMGEADALCTAPISKAAIKMGGYNFPGHTEFLAERTGSAEFAMSFFAGPLRVILYSTHVPLAKAIKEISRERLAWLIRFTDRELERLMGKRPSIAIAGLNPHASENGLFGDDEAREIVPAIDDCRRDGIDVSGPYSPDTIFLRGYRGEFDAVIALYHDQGTIPVKCLSFGSAVNVTLGLPIIRTSVDHGTAFDIAGKNAADASSMVAAIRLAGKLAANSRRPGAQ